MTKTDLILAALFAFYLPSLSLLLGRNLKAVSVVSHYAAINIIDARHTEVHDSLSAFLLNDCTVKSCLGLMAMTNII